MSKNIVVVSGSPRTNGNTEIIADAFIKGAEAAGNTVTKLLLSTLKINGCTDCKYCFSHEGQCVQRDGMDDIYPALRNADMLVFATPIYFHGFTAQMKAMIDRLYVAMGKSFPITETALLTVYADTDTTVCEPIIAHYTAFTEYLKWENKGIIAVDSVEEKGDISGHPSLKLAEQLGSEIR